MGLRIINRLSNEKFVEERLSQLRCLVQEHEARLGARDGGAAESKLVELLRKIEAAKVTINDKRGALDFAHELEQEIKDSNAELLGNLSALEPTRILDLL